MSSEGQKITRLEPGPYYSKAVIHNGIAYLSGIVPEESTLGPDVVPQVKSVLQKIDDVLKLSGTNKSRLLTANVYLADIGEWGKMNEVWSAWIDPENKPARTTVEAKMTKPTIRVEITVTAAL